MLKLFDKTFFKLAFLFLLIILAGFIVLFVIGSYDLNNSKDPIQPKNDFAKTPVTTRSLAR
jgi:hypothetical protein